MREADEMPMKMAPAHHVDQQFASAFAFTRWFVMEALRCAQRQSSEPVLKVTVRYGPGADWFETIQDRGLADGRALEIRVELDLLLELCGVNLWPDEIASEYILPVVKAAFA